jgi:hypothetical protein
LKHLHPEKLQEELATAQSLDVHPMHVDDPDLEDFANAGEIKWVVTQSGDLLVVPHTVGEKEIAHSVLTDGKPVLAAGVANIAVDIDVDYHDIEGFWITNQSSDYPIDPKSLQIGIQAFQDRYGITFEHAADISDHANENGQNVDSPPENVENNGKEDQKLDAGSGSGGGNGGNGNGRDVAYDGDGRDSDTENDDLSDVPVQNELQPEPNQESTVWDAIRPTQPVYEGTVIPRSFELSTETGDFWVHGNATEHLEEYARANIARKVAPELVEIATQAQLTSLKAAVEEATRQGITYDSMMTIDQWELKFGPSRQPGLLPVIYHALYKRRP